MSLKLVAKTEAVIVPELSGRLEALPLQSRNVPCEVKES
jgi:hypothetical protein